MKIKRRDKINKPTKIAMLILAVGLLAFITYWFAYGINNNSTNNASDQKASSDQEQHSNLEDNPDTKSIAPNADKPAAPTSSSKSNKKQVQMTASADKSDGTVFIRGGANYPVLGGSCYALLSGPSGQSIRKDSTVLSNPASTDCKTISIPMAELASGKWSFTLNYTSENYEGTSNEVTFNV